MLKQYRRLNYSELAFCLLDSVACQALAQLPMGWFPKKTVRQRTISAITPETWERINPQLLLSAQGEGVEKGRKVRVDSTVTDSPIHAPHDSTLLWDSVRTVGSGCWSRPRRWRGQRSGTGTKRGVARDARHG